MVENFSVSGTVELGPEQVVFLRRLGLTVVAMPPSVPPQEETAEKRLDLRALAPPRSRNREPNVGFEVYDLDPATGNRIPE